jgi:putative transposase
LAYKKNLWNLEKRGVSKYDMNILLPKWKQENMKLQKVYSQVLQNVQERVDLAFRAFFRRVKNHENPGYPRFKGRGNYVSFTYPQYKNTFSLNYEENKIHVPKIGDIKAKIHRKVEGKIKRLTIHKTTTGKWFAIFVLEKEDSPSFSNGLPSIGVDLGLEKFAVLSNGNEIKNPRFFRKEEEVLTKIQSKMDKLPKGSKERNKAKKVVQRIYERISNKRQNFAHQLSHSFVNKFGTICFEDLSVQKMIETGTRGLSKSISDVAWPLFITLTSYKAANAGSRVVMVNPRNTSKMCSSCGFIKEDLFLKDRVYKCPACSNEMDRDHNAALNILRLGTQSLKLYPSG